MAHVMGKSRLTLTKKKCPIETAKVLLKCQAALPILQPIESITANPILAFDRHTRQLKLLECGYHGEPHLTYVQAANGNPKEMTFAKAVRLIDDLLSDFKFTTPADKARAYAAILTPAIRAGFMIDRKAHIPAFVFEADQSQTGKTFLVEMISKIYGESPRTFSQKKGGVGSEDEAISEGVLSGKRFIFFDNYRGTFDSPLFESVMTSAGDVALRTPHRASIEASARHCIFFFTSNGIATKGKDGANRFCVIRLRKQPADHPFKWERSALLNHIEENQMQYLGAIHSIIKQHLAFGWLTTGKAGHDFKEWAALVNAIIIDTIKLPNVGHFMDGHEAAKARISDPNLVFLREVCLKLKERGELGQQMQAAQIGELCQAADIEIRGLRPNEKPNIRIGYIMKAVFKETDRLQIEDFSVEREERPEFSKNAGEILQTKFYTFAETSE